MSKDTRIDLTQFEGNNLDKVTLTEKGAYDAEYEELTKNMGPGIPAGVPDGIVFAPPPPGELARVEWLGHRTGWIQIEDARAIAAVSDLLAELKRCYAMLDAIAYEVAPCRECGGHREEEGLVHDCQNYCRCEEFNGLNIEPEEK